MSIRGSSIGRSVFTLRTRITGLRLSDSYTDFDTKYFSLISITMGHGVLVLGSLIFVLI